MHNTTTDIDIVKRIHTLENYQKGVLGFKWKNIGKVMTLLALVICFAFGFGMTAQAAPTAVYEEQGYTRIHSTEEGLAVLAQRIQIMDGNPIALCFDDNVNVYALFQAVTALNSNIGISTYQQMMYAGAGCEYSYNYAVIQINWKMTAEQEALFDATVGMLAQSFVAGTVQDQVKAVHDWICNNVVYDDATVLGVANRHTGYNALFEGTAVCDGYATLFQKFMDKLGIPCYCVTSVDHAWNMVNIGGIWYRVDCTWDDQPYGISYEYFLK